ncbi:Muskelin 1, intracellular mediator containing kelch motif [Dinochytrium kinnereticum]|nr:Muskelin 1, intracellular mediator containing kelch motif [Dinochytrium kinnereticum]
MSSAEYDMVHADGKQGGKMMNYQSSLKLGMPGSGSNSLTKDEASSPNLSSKAQSQKLQYDIQSWSSHSASYFPKNIMVNKPNDQSSRWSSKSNDQMQYITIKLDQVSVVHTITFGKYYKIHVCNMKEFKVFGGLNPNNMIELLHSGLRNDSEPETFSLKYKTNDVVFPCQYIKIAPLVAWGANFNFSIWYVEIRGICQRDIVEKAYWNYINYRESEVIRLCMKHFRQRNYLEAFSSLQERTQIQLEDHVLNNLHKSLVLNGDFNTAEELIQQASDRDLFQEYISGCAYKAIWKRILPPQGMETPCMRGGHQMCIDVDGGMIYLFGGWDGTRDLSDFWSFNISSKRWACISTDTRRNGGPGPRSCHKICFDPKMRQIYTMGRYVDPDNRPNVNLDGDFWRYDVERTEWTRISGNTQLDGGPELIYDHQMVVDSDAQVMYVFGGRLVGPDPNQTPLYSGLFAYCIATNRWRLIKSDANQPDTSIQLKSRIGHSMLLNPKTRELYIFAGQRGKEYLSDFYIYDIDSDTVHEVSRDYSKQGGPDAGFTQRATIDFQLGEFYVLSGLQKDKNSTQEVVKNSFWSYNIRKMRWTRVYHNENTGPEYWEKMKDLEPVPRFAHQLVYDPIHHVQYLFGGNPGDNTNLNLRLDDFWELGLLRPEPSDILRRAKFQIRKQKFREMCKTGNTFRALSYLQNDIAEVVDHDDETESKSFRELTQWLFQWQASEQRNSTAWSDNAFASSQHGTSSGATTSSVGLGGLASGGSSLGGQLSVRAHPGFSISEDPFQTRTELYESLLEFFPEGMREPKGNLVDLIDFIPNM